MKNPVNDVMSKLVRLKPGDDYPKGGGAEQKREGLGEKINESEKSKGSPMSFLPDGVNMCAEGGNSDTRNEGDYHPTYDEILGGPTCDQGQRKNEGRKKKEGDQPGVRQPLKLLRDTFLRVLLWSLVWIGVGKHPKR